MKECEAAALEILRSRGLVGREISGEDIIDITGISASREEWKNSVNLVGLDFNFFPRTASHSSYD